MAQPLHMTYSSEWLWDSSLSLRGNLNLENTKSSVLHIPHCLRDLLWMVRAWSLVSPIFSSLLMSRASSSSQSLLKLITSVWHTFIKWMNPMIMGDHSRWLSPLLHSGSSHSSTGFLRSYSNLCSSLQKSWLRNQTYLLVSSGNTLVVKVYPWLNQQ